MDSDASPRTVETFFSTVLGVPLAVVAPKLRNILEIRKYGLNRAISCCLVENGLPPTTMGCIRRSVLCPLEPHHTVKKAPTPPPLTTISTASHAQVDLILRERLVSSSQDGVMVEVVLEYLPCSPAEANRSPFGMLGMQYLGASWTTYRAIASTRNPHQCLVAVHNISQLRAERAGDLIDHWRTFGEGHIDAAGMSLHDPVGLTADEERDVAARHVAAVWHRFLDRVLAGIEQTILDESIIATGGPNGLDTELQRAYNAFESSYCGWAATSSATLCRGTVVEAVEPALEGWAHTLHELKQQRVMVDGVKKDAEASQRISAEIAKQMVEERDAFRDALASQEKGEEGEKGENSSSSAAAPQDGQGASPSSSTQEGKGAAVAPANKRAPFPNSQYIYSSDVILADRSSVLMEKLGKLKKNPSSWSTGCTPCVISKLFDPKGVMDEQVAREIFDSLIHVSPRRKGKKIITEDDTYVTSSELTALLLSAETFGGKSPPTGCSKSAADRRAEEGGSSSDAVNSLPADSAFRQMIHKHDEFKQSAREEEARSRSEDVISRYDFREKGRLYFDEFCLALMSLFKIQTCS